MVDPIRKVIKGKRFKIFIWRNYNDYLQVSYLNRLCGFADIEDIRLMNELTGELIKYYEEKGEL